MSSGLRSFIKRNWHWLIIIGIAIMIIYYYYRKNQDTEDKLKQVLLALPAPPQPSPPHAPSDNPTTAASTSTSAVNSSQIEPSGEKKSLEEFEREIEEEDKKLHEDIAQEALTKPLAPKGKIVLTLSSNNHATDDATTAAANKSELVIQLHDQLAPHTLIFAMAFHFSQHINYHIKDHPDFAGVYEIGPATETSEYGDVVDPVAMTVLENNMIEHINAERTAIIGPTSQQGAVVLDWDTMNLLITTCAVEEINDDSQRYFPLGIVILGYSYLTNYFDINRTNAAVIMSEGGFRTLIS